MRFDCIPPEFSPFRNLKKNIGKLNSLTVRKKKKKKKKIPTDRPNFQILVGWGQHNNFFFGPYAYDNTPPLGVKFFNRITRKSSCQKSASCTSTYKTMVLTARWRQCIRSINNPPYLQLCTQLLTSLPNAAGHQHGGGRGRVQALLPVRDVCCWAGVSRCSPWTNLLQERSVVKTEWV